MESMEKQQGDYPSQQRQQIVFRVDEKTFIAFKKKLLDNGNMKVQTCLEGVVKRIIDGEIKL